MPLPSKIYYKIILLILLFGLALALSQLPIYLSPYLVVGLLIFGLLCLIILKDPMWGMYLLVFFLPFERIGAYDLAGMTIRLSQVVAVLTILAWILRGFNLQSFKLRPQPLFWPILAFLAINALAITNSPNPDRSLKVWLFTAFTLSICLLIPNIIRHGDQLPKAPVQLNAEQLERPAGIDVPRQAGRAGSGKGASAEILLEARGIA